MYVNSFLIIASVFLCLTACTKKQIPEQESKSTGGNFGFERTQYHLDFVTADSDYLDENGIKTFLVTNKIIANGKVFAHDSIAKAIEYVGRNISENKGIAEVYTISIKKNNGSFEDVWTWSNPIHVTSGRFGIQEMSISLGASYASFNNKVQNRLHINFRTKDIDDGYKLFTLNYIFKNGIWELVSREKINTIVSEITMNDNSYCIDTINSGCQREGKNFELTRDYIFRLDDRVCY